MKRQQSQRRQNQVHYQASPGLPTRLEALGKNTSWGKMKGVGVAARSNNKQGQMIIRWPGARCHVEVTKCSSFPENQLGGNKRGTGRLRVRFKAALSPRGDNGALYSVTKEGCGLTRLPPTSEATGNPSSLQSHSGLPAWRTGMTIDFVKSPPFR